MPVTTNNQVLNHDPLQAGWADLTYYVNSYAKANGIATASSAAYTTAGISNANPFTLQGIIDTPPCLFIFIIVYVSE